MKKLGIVLYILLLVSTFAHAATPKAYTMSGTNTENTHAAGYRAKMGSDPFSQLVFAYPTAKRNPADYTPLVGDVDGDGQVEIFIPADSGGYKAYTINNGVLTLKYQNFFNGSTTAGTNTPSAMLYDIDGDEDYEFFYCGRGLNSQDMINGIDFNSTHPLWMWRYNLTNSGDFVSMCGVTDDASPPNRNVTYPPKGFTLSGTPYGIWPIGDDVNGDDGQLGFVRVNLVTGAGVEFFAKNAGDADCTNIYGIGAAKGAPSYGAGHYFSGATSIDPYMNNIHNVAVCEDPNNANNKVAYMVADCNVASTYKRGILALDLTTMTTDVDFDGAGYDPLPIQISDPITSPSCMDSSSNDIIVVAFEDPDSEFNTYVSENSNSFSKIAGEGTTINVNMIGELFQGEYNSQINDFRDDVCLFGSDSVTKQSIIYCVDSDNPFLGQDEVFAISNYSNTNVDFLPRPWLHTTISKPSLSDGEFGTDARDDFWVFHGVYSADVSEPDSSGPADFVLEEGELDPNGEGAFRHAKSYPPQDGTCSPVDIDNNGFMDAVCFNKNNITVFLDSSINSGVNFKVLGVDVSGEQLCTGNNQTFFATFDNAKGYEDSESDRVRMGVDCFNDGNATENTYTTYGTDLTISCFYNVSGNHNARVFVRDEGSGLADTIFFTTDVFNTSCQVGDGFPSALIGAPDDGNGNGEPSAFPNPVDVVDGLFDLAGADDQNSKDLILWLVLFILAGTFVFEGKGSLMSFGVAIGIMVVGMVVFTVIGFMNPIYMVVLVILALASFTVYAAMRGRGM